MLFRSLKKSVIFSVIAVLCYGFFVSCDNPFSSSLGSKVDVEAPTISVISPDAGAFLRDTIRFTGVTTAYREVKQVDVRILNTDSKKPPLLNWTTLAKAVELDWVKGYTLTGDAKAKNWSLDLDTRALFAEKDLDDGFMKIQFRVYDVSSDPNRQPSQTMEMVYIVKNNPSVVKLSMPDQARADEKLRDYTQDDNPEEVVTDSEIKGQITDRRGLKPGYPMIKIWPYEMNEPEGNDENWGWASLFLAGIDTLDEEGFSYKNRNEQSVVNSVGFSFRLSEFTINPSTRRVIYDMNPKYKSLNPSLYRFRIITSDTYFNSKAGDPKYMWPREPLEGEEDPIIGYYPVEDNSSDETLWDSGKSYVVRVISGGERPNVELNYDTLGDIDVVRQKTTEVPNIYITADSTPRKIAVGKTGRADFQLQILTSHPEQIDRAILRYEHTGEYGYRWGYLKWDDDDLPGESRGYVNDTGYDYVNNKDGTFVVTDEGGNTRTHSYRAYYGHRGWWKDGDENEGTYFRFTAKGDLKDEKGEQIFKTSTEPYSLSVIVYANDLYYAEPRYTLYMDGKGPDVNIRSVRGASADPSEDGDVYPSIAGIINDAPYTVNGNIQVSVNRSDDQGILATKWIVEEGDDNYLIKHADGTFTVDPNSMLAKIQAYGADPKADLITFFDNITTGRMSGDVIPPASSGLDPDMTWNFKFNTWKDNGGNNDWNGKALWLYVIARDGVHNLGFTLQKIHVDDSGDMPIMETPDTFFSTTDEGGIKSKEELYLNKIASTPPATGAGSNKDRKNVLGNEGIQLTFIDDDGINLNKNNLIITLTNLNDGKTVVLNTPDQLRKFLSGNRYLEDHNGRQWAGVLSQEIMAQALYPDKTPAPRKLDDGYYYLSIEVKDNIDVKVGITPPVNVGDTPVAVGFTQEYYFAVRNDDPKITITSPDENSVLNGENLTTIYGMVSSRVAIQRLDIIFEPDVVSNPVKLGKSPAESLPLYSTSTYTNQVTPFTDAGKDADGNYLYYWKRESVNFDPDDLGATSDNRKFSLIAYDGLGYEETVDRTVEVDTTPPELNLDSFNFGRTEMDEEKGTVNGKVPIEISVYDASGVKINDDGTVQLKWWVVPVGTTPTGWNWTIPTGSIGGQFTTADGLGGGRYWTVFNTGYISYPDDIETITNIFTNGGEYLIYAMAEDAAGNWSNVELLTYTQVDESSPKIPKPFKINQAMDRPVLMGETEGYGTDNPLSPKDGAPVKNLGGNTLTISGTIYDDDGFNTAGVDKTDAAKNKYVWIRFPTRDWAEQHETPTDPNGLPANNAITWDAWQPVPGEMPDPNYINFAYPASRNANGYSYFNSDGNKYYQIRILDEPLPGSPVPESPYGNPPGKNPERVLISPAIPAVESIYGSTALSGGGTRDYYYFLVKNNDPQVFFKNFDPDYRHAYDEGYDPNWDPNGPQDKNFLDNVWSRPSRPAFSSLDDITVKDINDDDILIPGLRNTLKNAWIKEGTGVGEAYFYYGSKRMEPAIKTVDQTIAQSLLTPKSGTSDEFELGAKISDTTWDLWLASFNSAGDGSYYIGIEAVDRAENKTRVEWTFYKDSTGPDVTFTNIDADGTSTISGRSDVFIRGRFSDTYSDIADSYRYRFDGTDWKEVLTTSNGGTKSGRNASWVIKVDDVADGDRTLYIEAKDMASNTSPLLYSTTGVKFRLDRNAPAVSEPDDMIVTGITGTNRKLADLERIFSAAYAKENTTNPVAIYTLSGVVYDRYLSSLTAVFNPGGGANALTPVTLTGIDTWINEAGAVGTHPNESARFRIRRAIPSEVSLPLVDSPTQYRQIDNNDGNDYDPDNLYVWSLTVTENDLYNILQASAATPPAGWDDGIFDDGRIRRQLTITAKDEAGLNSENKNWRFYLDSEKPKVTFVNAQNGSYLNALPLEGTASDGTNIKEIRYFITKQNYTDNNWYHGNNWTTTQANALANLPLRTNWPVLYSGGTNPQSTVIWRLSNSISTTQFPTGELPEGHYRVYLYVTDYSLAASNAGNPADALIEFYIDKTDPVLDWTSARKNFYNTDSLGSGTTLVLTATDPNTILSAEGEVRIYNGAKVDEATVKVEPIITVPPTTLPASSVQLKVTIEGLPKPTLDTAPRVRYTLVLKIQDGAGREASSNHTLDFTLDDIDPDVDIKPVGNTNAAIVGRVQFYGSFTKLVNLNQSPVSRVAFAIATTTDGEEFSDPPALEDMADGTLKANGWYFADASSPDENPNLKTNTQELAFITEGLSNANVIIPNTRNLMGTVDEKQYLGSDTTTIAGTYTFNGVNIPAGETVNKLVIHFLAIDEAGNSKVITQEYWVYPEGDRPIVTVDNPDETLDPDNRLLNGTIRISGSAVDNVYVKNVWFRVLVGTEVKALSIPVWNQTTWEVQTGPGAGDQYPVSKEGKTGWYMANQGGRANVSWWANININGELEPDAGSPSRGITVEVKAEDSYLNAYGDGYVTTEGMFSRDKSVDATVVSGAPNFGDELVLSGKGSNAVHTAPNVLFINNISVAGDWSLIANSNVRGRSAYAIKVQHSSKIASIRWTRPSDGAIVNLLDSGNPYNVFTETTPGTYAGDINTMDAGTGTIGIAVRTVAATPDGDYKDAYWVVVDINSKILEDKGGSFATRADYYTVNFEALDSSRPSPLSSKRDARIPIDNLSPEGEWKQNTNIAGSAATLGGEAGDTQGVIRGLSRIVLWFSRAPNGIANEKFVPWNELATPAPGAFEGTTNVPLTQAERNDTGINGLPTLAASPNFKLPKEYLNGDITGNNSSIVIDRTDPNGTTAHHGHKHRMGFYTAGGDYGTGWYVTLDSTLMTSGRTTAHWIVYDKAGNAQYYSTPLRIMNNIPRITRITLGTDIRGDLDLQDTLGVEGGNLSFTNADEAKGGISGIRAAFEDKLNAQVKDLTGEALDTAEGIRAITVDTSATRRYGVVYEEQFNVRNNLLAVQVEIGESMNQKARRYSVEHVTTATPYTGTDFYNNIVAGNIYMIDNPGNFPWDRLGATGTFERGFVFLATESGANLTGLSGTYNNAAVWALTTATGNGSVTPVNYAYNISGDNGKLAEFVYGNNAFGTTENRIGDFTMLATTAADGRPLAYLQASAIPWTNHSLFIVRVYDIDPDNASTPTPDDLSFGDFALLAIRVNNNDKTVPYAQLYDLNPKAEEASVAAALSTGTSMGDNRLRGGLQSATENQLIVKSGHIEPRGTQTTGIPRTSLTSVQMGGSADGTASPPVYRPVSTPGAYFTRDTVSGQVILRGYVEDDQRIGRVDLNFGGTNTVTILTSVAPGGTTVGSLLTAASNVSFIETIDLNRHRVEWSYLWNSQTMPTNTVVGDVTVTARAYPYSATDNQTSTANQSTVRILGTAVNNATYDYFNPTFPAWANANQFRRYNQLTVNLRPYITGIIRNKTLSYQDERSLQGRYMLRREEQFVVAGFNLGNATGTNSAPTLALPNMNATLVATGNGDTNAVLTTAGQSAFRLPNINPYNYRIFLVPTTATTSAATAANNGVVNYTVGGNAAVNARTIPGTTTNRLGQPWNTERSLKNGSDLWDDFTAVHIWQSNDYAGANNNNGYFRSTGDNWPIINPAMSVVPGTGVLHASHNENGSGGNAGRLMASTNSGTAAIGDRLIDFIDPMIHSDIYYSPGRGTLGAERWTVSSLIGQAGAWSGWSHHGGIYINGPGGNTLRDNQSQPVADRNTDNINIPGNAGYYVESNWYNASSNSGTQATNPRTTEQFFNPHIITSYNTGGTTEYIHVSYYDSKDGSIKYKNNVRGTPGTIANWVEGNNPAKTWVNLDGGFDFDDIFTNNGTTQYLSSNNGNSQTAANRYLRTVSVTNGQLVTNGQAVYVFGPATTGTPPNNTTTTINATSAGYISMSYPQALTSGGNYTVYAPPRVNGQGTQDAVVLTVFPTANYNTTRVVNYAGRRIQGTGDGNILARSDNIKAGEHNAIAVTSEGYPVIAYYDATNSKLKLAMSNSLTPNAATNWTIHENVIPTNNPNHVGTGLYVSMAINTRATGSGMTQNTVHIAAMNTNGNLVYISGTITITGTTPSFTNTPTVQMVDNVGTVGRWSKISLDQNGYPWIAYQDDGKIGSTQGAKIAYLGGGFTKPLADINGTVITGWETMHVPSQFRVENPTISGRENGRIGMECFPTRNVDATGTLPFWGAAVSYYTTYPETRYRIAYYVK